MKEQEFRFKEMRVIKHSQVEEYAASGWIIEELNNDYGGHGKIAWRRLPNQKTES